MRASSVLLFQSQKPFNIFGLPYGILGGSALLFLVGMTLLLVLGQEIVMFIFGAGLVGGMVPVLFACRKDHHANRIFFSGSWWKRKRLRRFAAGGPYAERA